MKKEKCFCAAITLVFPSVNELNCKIISAKKWFSFYNKTYTAMDEGDKKNCVYEN